MDVCNKCNCVGTIVKPGLRCRSCVNEYKSKWQRARKDRRCEHCNQPFASTGSKECSLKCKLLNRIKKVNGCWEWQGKLTNVGYGKIHHLHKHRLVHRESYLQFKGSIPKGLLVCHSCDNKRCINPSHLWLGTQKDNINDAVLKCRMNRERNNETGKFTKAF